MTMVNYGCDLHTQVETAFIACLLNKPENMVLCGQKFKPEYIADAVLRSIYEAIQSENSADLRKLAAKCNVQLYDLMEVQQLVHKVSDAWFNGLAAQIMEQYKQRKIDEIRQTAKADEVGMLIDEINHLQYFEPQASDEYLQNVERIITGKADERLVETCFYNIDRVIGGFRKSELVVIGGRPGSGKTTFALNVAYKMACQGKKVGFFSLEMAEPELMDKLVKAATGLSTYTESDIGEVVEVKRYIDGLKLKIYDNPRLKINDIYNICKLEKDFDCVFIDHLAILQSEKRYNSQYERVTDLSGRLKVMAKELNIPVVALAQLNRGVENRDVKAPTLADLRDSGSIEQDADLVGFIYRPEYHLRQNEPDANDAKHATWEEKMRKAEGVAKFILAKNRRGELRNFNFQFRGEIHKFFEEQNYGYN